ncbi:MAG: TRAP-type mannitol/chloroaromatic compound transport system permease large subunit [Oceanospirillaceae bacterium]|jgi:TRAP-type mannitol/chloroaromatic compound transport system permease large subunit
MELFFLLLLVLLMIVALTSGFPVAFALPGSAILAISLAALCGWLFAGNPDAYFAQGGPVQWLSAGVTNIRSLYWDVERDTLIAIPLFIFMGIMLQRSKIAEDLLVAMAQLFGPVPGGLGISVVIVGALLAATTGIVGATVIAMGLISMPAMLRNNYSKPLASGIICASGTLGQIIPPSIVLIILADQLSSAADQAATIRKADYKEITGELTMPSTYDIASASAGDMFMGAMVPGAILVGIYILYILVTALIKPSLAPPVPFEGKYDSQFLKTVLFALVPPLGLIFIVLGSIILGIATVNQAGAIGAVGAMIMGGYRLVGEQKNRYYPAILALLSILAIGILTSNYDLNIKSTKSEGDEFGIMLAVIAVIGLLIAVTWSAWRTFKVQNTLQEVMIETAKTTSMVFIILIGAAMLTTAFRGFGGEHLVKEFLTSLPGGFWTQFVVVMIVIFLLGFFLDFIEIAVVVVPIVAPILMADPSANITAVWLGVMIGLNIQTSFLTPPFGFALFYLRGVAPKVVRTLDIYKGAIAFIGLQIVALIIAGSYPPLVNYLPNRTALTSVTAPPPMNPRIQGCLETFVFKQYETIGNTLRASINDVKAIDISYLPKKQKQGLSESFDKAANTFALVKDIEIAELALDEFSPGYRPLHIEVRAIQKKVRSIDKKTKQNLKIISRAKGDAEQDALVAKLTIVNAEMLADKKQLETKIPAQWKEQRAQFELLAGALKKARSKYRNNVDGAYEPIVEMTKTIAAAQELAAMESTVLELKQVILGVTTKAEAKPAMEVIKGVERQLGSIAATSAIKTKLSKARRALKKVKTDKAMTEFNKALKLLTTEIEWRKKAATQLLPALNKYDSAIKFTIGIRLQERLTLAQAKSIASCLSVHRDISLNF